MESSFNYTPIERKGRGSAQRARANCYSRVRRAGLLEVGILCRHYHEWNISFEPAVRGKSFTHLCTAAPVAFYIHLFFERAETGLAQFSEYNAYWNFGFSSAFIRTRFHARMYLLLHDSAIAIGNQGSRYYLRVLFVQH